MNNRFGRLQLVRSVLVSLALLLTGCISSPASSPSNSATPALIPVKVGTIPILSNVVLQIAETEGYFVEAGLAVELVPFQSSKEFIPLLLAGQLDVAQPALTAAFFNAATDSDKLKMVFPVTTIKVQDCAYVAFFVRRADLETGIYAEPANWHGTRIALPPAGAQSTTGYITDRFLQQGGLGLADVELPIVDLQIQAEALRTGQIDIVLAAEPWVTRMKADSDLALLLPAEPYAPDLTASALLYGEKLLADRDIGNRFAVAYLKAVRQYLQGATARNVEIIANLTELEPDIVNQLCLADIPADGQMHIGPVMDYQAWLMAEGLLNRIADPAEFADTGFAEEANRILGDRQ